MSQRILDTGNKILVERPQPHVVRNTFNLSHDHKFSCNIGELIPAYVMECLPNDTKRIKAEALTRLQPMISPVMHRINQRIEFFFVASRILKTEWESFISPPKEGSTPPSWSFFQDVTISVHDLGDYLGLPLGEYTDQQFDALPFAAYKKVWSDWYRDEDINESDEFVMLDSGDVSTRFNDLNTVMHRNYDRDYFTSVKPWAQKGPVVIVPSNGGVPLPDVLVQTNTAFPSMALVSTAPIPINSDGKANISSDWSSGTHITGEMQAGDGGDAFLHNVNIDAGSSGLYAQTSSIDISALGILVSDLRQQAALQRFLEADARGGTRYVEMNFQHFGARSSDSRMQRAEYLGSNTQPITISEVLNTTGTDTAPQGTMAGHGIAVQKHYDGICYTAEEHGYIIGVCSVLPVTGYYQGIPRMFQRSERLDYLFPEFAAIGEQPLLGKELYYTPTDNVANESVFGYNPRYAEYRIQGNRVSGDFRTSLDFWHLARKFASLPALNQTFLQCVPDETVDRIFAVIETDVDHLLIHYFFEDYTERVLPRLALPSLS